MIRLPYQVCLLVLAFALSGCASLWSQATGPLTRHNHAPIMTARDGAITTAGGSAFVARGVNLQYGDSPRDALPAVAAIAGTGANIIRLELRRNTTAWQLRRALDAAVARKVTVMAFYWESDITCHSDSAVLERDVRDLWLGQWKGVLSEAKYQPYLMLNIANEWGSAKGEFADYLATYAHLIGQFRAAGLRAPIVIDAAECGQDTGSFLDGRAQRLIDADPLKNVIVSVHAYNRPWNSPGAIDGNIAALKATGAPFLVGEFGDRELVEDGNAVDHLYLMKQAAATGTGWIAWSWKGNGETTRVLDMSAAYGVAELTRRGQDVVNGPDGLKSGH